MNAMDVPYLEKDEIRAAARDLRRRAFADDSPVPVDLEILAFDYLYAEHDVEVYVDQPLAPENEKDVLGVTYPEKNEIHVDSQLADEHYGRFRFTIAHEIGHWMLHRPLYLDEDGQEGGSRQQADEPRIVTLRRDVEESDEERDYNPAEWQANFFAIWLLLPDDALRQEFDRRFGERPFSVPSELCDPEAEYPIRPLSRRLVGTPKDGHVPLHERFLLSREATAIALEERGYLAEPD